MLSKISALMMMSSSVSAASTADWKKRSVYQVLTDRFAKN
jgi:hypothetical protein